MAINLAPFGRWTLRDKAAPRRLALRLCGIFRAQRAIVKNSRSYTMDLVVLLSLAVIAIGLASSPASAEMTVQEYERLKASKRPDDIASVRQYVHGFFNGLVWASTKSKTEFGLELFCNTDSIATPEQAFAVIDQEIRRKKLGDDVKAILPLSLISTEALFRQYPCKAPRSTQGTLMPGPKFAQYCNSADLGPMGLCAGFINAVVEILNTVPLYGRRACFPATFTVQTGMTAVQRWMQANPNDVKYDAREIVVVALAKAFPCSSRRGN